MIVLVAIVQPALHARLNDIFRVVREITIREGLGKSSFEIIS